MDILQNISNKLKEAMRNKDTLQLQILRNIKAELLKIQTSGKQETINENDFIKIIKTLIKEKKESIEYAKNAKRDEMIEQENKISTNLTNFFTRTTERRRNDSIS